VREARVWHKRLALSTQPRHLRSSDQSVCGSD
jgi:hypothetical protein